VGHTVDDDKRRWMCNDIGCLTTVICVDKEAMITCLTSSRIKD